MSATGPVDRVVAVLESAGYERVDQPSNVGGVPFEFAAMLAGRTSLDLIAVVDLAVDLDDERIRRRIEGLARALDLVRSRRSLTVVLVGPRRGPELVQSIASVSRVLIAGSPGDDDDAGLRDALAVMLPLDIATEDGDAMVAWVAARDRFAATHPEEAQAVLPAAVAGRTAVEDALRGLLSSPIDEISTNDEDEGEES